MSAIVSVYAIFADEEEALRIGRAMVEERLAACVNMFGPCNSIYRWQGRIEEAVEFAAILKTRRECAELLIARIAELHSYEQPAAVVWPIERALEGYSAWVRAETEGDQA
jgi:periplasmic divalent cation tolerance protein